MQSKIDTEKSVDTSTQVEKKQIRRSVEERRRIVEETFTPGTSVAEVARRHGINANQIFAWRKRYLSGELGGGRAIAAAPGFIPVEVIEEEARKQNADGKPSTVTTGSSWMAEVELPNGMKVRFVAGLDVREMHRVLSVARELT